MVYRIYVEKKKDLAKEAADLLHEARELLQIRSLTGVRIINRYDVENIEKDLFDYAVKTVFSEPQLDTVSETIQAQGAVFAVEYLPGQFDQRADSAAQCIQIISQGERPTVRTAKVYVLAGELSSSFWRACSSAIFAAFLSYSALIFLIFGFIVSRSSFMEAWQRCRSDSASSLC